MKRKRKRNLFMLTGSLYYCTLLLKEFLLFSTVPIPVKMVTPKKTTIAVHLMVLFVVNALEDMRAWLAFFSSYSICFLVVYVVIRRECEQTLARVRISQTYISIIIISLQRTKG